MASPRELADLAVERLREHSWGRSDVHVHWDDCDMDERRFWIYIKVDGIGQLRFKDAKSTLVREFSREIQNVFHKFKKDTHEQYEVIFERETSPRRRYVKRYFHNYNNEFCGYDGDTWVYVLTFYGF